MLIDNHGRPVNYLRLAITDKCNLRCSYCMPFEGIQFLPKKQLLSYEEIIRMIQLMAEMGISKVRITGGEPFVRRDIMQLLENIVQIPGIEQVHLTTNGTRTAEYVPRLKELGIKSVNLSIDSLDRNRFFEMTRRDELPKVLETLHALIAHDIPTKINSVVMSQKNQDDIHLLTALTKELPISVRFIEEMPFNGSGSEQVEFLSYQRIIEKIRGKYPTLEKITDEAFSTSYNYKIPGFAGTVGVIAAFSRTFCGTCNRLRVTPTGDVKTCLYDEGVFSIRDLLRSTNDDRLVQAKLKEVIGKRAKDGFEAEKKRSTHINESMTTIGG